MKWFVLILGLLAASCAFAQAPTISPTNPVVTVAGSPVTFNCTASCGTSPVWSCANTSNGGPCIGTFNTTTHVYTPPATFAAPQSLGGYQLLPPDHIFNVDIFGQPAASNSATIMAGLSTLPVSIFPAKPYNYANASTPTDSMVFQYTPANNGTFITPQWPDAVMEAGWFDARTNGNADHHQLVIDTTTGNLNEKYQYYTIGLNGGCPTCNSQSGVKYGFSDYGLPVNGATDAAGMFLLPLVLRTSEFVNAVNTGGAIKHALRFTLSNGYICGSNTANACIVGSSGNATGTRHIWPATAEALAGGGTVPYGARFRLKSSFNCGTFSAAAQIICNTFKHYGIILADGGLNWEIDLDYDNMPAAEVAALKEINAAAIAQSNWEAVDVGSLMESLTSGAVNTGEVITYSSSTGTVKTHVDLQGTAVNVAPGSNQQMVIAGTPQYSLPFFSNGAFTCAMSPSVGSLTSDCKYTAPASVTPGTLSTTTVTATSSVTSSVTAQIIINVCSASNCNFLQDTTDYTDTHSVKWFSGTQYGFGLSNAPQWQGCCQNDGSFPNITDKRLWWNHFASSLTQNDVKVDIHVPNGTYQVVFNNGTSFAVGADVRYFYGNGTLLATVDSTVAAGGVHLPYTLTANIVVTNNILSFYNAGIGNQSSNTGDISSLSAIRISLPPSPNAPPKPVLLLMTKQRGSNETLPRSSSFHIRNVRLSFAQGPNSSWRPLGMVGSYN